MKILCPLSVRGLYVRAHSRVLSHAQSAHYAVFFPPLHVPPTPFVSLLHHTRVSRGYSIRRRPQEKKHGEKGWCCQYFGITPADRLVYKKDSFLRYRCMKNNIKSSQLSFFRAPLHTASY
ncbi:hypothetical protein TNIN_144331 [Trichonephila inaurata madagascariensis]|uniref:Uncharacterized protein n=1 Tax=Trichonephila inaurata madagascariensis TaxID=2747483 RepID=A0A8X6MCR5_9ARAC|nr:hypothetical protein TNIN_144331 [Trichonephila inaurata madagascariensis]